MPFWIKKPDDAAKIPEGLRPSTESDYVLDPSYSSDIAQHHLRGDPYVDDEGILRNGQPLFPLINPKPRRKAREEKPCFEKCKLPQPEPLPKMNRYPVLRGKEGHPGQFPRSGYDKAFSPHLSPPNYLYKPGNSKRPVLNVQRRQGRASNAQAAPSGHHNPPPQPGSQKISENSRGLPSLQVTSPGGRNIPLEYESPRN